MFAISDETWTSLISAVIAFLGAATMAIVAFLKNRSDLKKDSAALNKRVDAHDIVNDVNTKPPEEPKP